MSSLHKVTVPDRRRRIVPEVVLSEALGNWDSGTLEGEGWAKEVSLQAT